MEELLTKLTEIAASVEKLSTRLGRVELNQRKLTEILLKKREKRKLRVEKRAPQNLGCVKYEKNFVPEAVHERLLEPGVIFEKWKLWEQQIMHVAQMRSIA